MFSRGKVIQNLVHLISKHHRLIHVHGEDGYGKSDITNYAAKYALEGRVDICSAHHIKIEQITTKKGLKDKILEEIGKHLSSDNGSN